MEQAIGLRLQQTKIMNIRSRYLHLKRCLAIGVLVFFSFHLYADDYMVNVSKINIRQKPSLDSSILGSIVKGSIVNVKSISDDWATIDYNGKDGYVSIHFLKKVTNQNVNQNISTENYKRTTETPNQSVYTANNQSVYAAKTIANSNPITYYNYNHHQEEEEEFLWYFKTGLMPISVYEDKFKRNKVSSLDFSMEFGASIPITIHDNPFYIEAALRLLRKNVLSIIDNGSYVYDKRGTILEIPVRLGYNLKLNDNASILTSIGPYFSYLVYAPLEYEAKTNLHIGIEPSIAFNYKNYNLGFQYSSPIFYKAYKNENPNVIMATLGFRFGNKDWDKVGEGLLIAGAIAAAASQVIAEANQQSGFTGTYQDDNAYLYEYDDYTDITDEERSKKKEYYEQKGERQKRYEQGRYETFYGGGDKDNYAAYAEDLRKIKDGSSLYKHNGQTLQKIKNKINLDKKRMKEIREKYKAKTGREIQKSYLEDWNPTNHELYEIYGEYIILKPK